MLANYGSAANTDRRSKRPDETPMVSSLKSNDKLKEPLRIFAQFRELRRDFEDGVAKVEGGAGIGALKQDVRLDCRNYAI